jgi:hypothetical protein
MPASPRSIATAASITRFVDGRHIVVAGVQTDPEHHSVAVRVFSGDLAEYALDAET